MARSRRDRRVARWTVASSRSTSSSSAPWAAGVGSRARRPRRSGRRAARPSSSRNWCRPRRTDGARATDAGPCPLVRNAARWSSTSASGVGGAAARGRPGPPRRRPGLAGTTGWCCGPARSTASQVRYSSASSRDRAAVGTAARRRRRRTLGSASATPATVGASMSSPSRRHGHQLRPAATTRSSCARSSSRRARSRTVRGRWRGNRRVTWSVNPGAVDSGAEHLPACRPDARPPRPAPGRAVASGGSRRRRRACRPGSRGAPASTGAAVLAHERRPRSRRRRPRRRRRRGGARRRARTSSPSGPRSRPRDERDAPPVQTVLVGEAAETSVQRRHQTSAVAHDRARSGAACGPRPASRAAPTSSRNSGCGRSGRLLNSGWAWVPTQNGWPGELDELDQPAVGRDARAAQPGLLEPARYRGLTS